MRLFVYGTLKRDFDNNAARRLRARGEYLDRAVIRAQLCKCGPHTGLVPGDGRVRGEVYRAPAHLLAYLDQYEGSNYCRVLTRVRMGSGEMRSTFVYMISGQ